VVNAEKALGKAIQPPSVDTIRSAVVFLKKVGALDTTTEALTPLGAHLARLPVPNVQVGKIVIMSAVFGCVTPAVTIAAMLGAKSPFLSPSDAREEANKARDSFARGKSDHLTLFAVAEAYEQAAKGGIGAAKRFCQRNFLSFATMRVVTPTVNQYLQALAEGGFLGDSVSGHALRSKGTHAVPPQYNRHSSSDRLVSAVLCSGLYPNIVQIKAPKHMIKTAYGAVPAENTAKELKYYTRDHGRAFLHPRSINFTQNTYETVWLAYSLMMETSKMYIHDTTQVSPYALLLFGDMPEVDVQQKAIVVDKWIRFSAPGRIAVLVRALRDELKGLLSTKIEHPQTDVSASPVTHAILKLLISNGY